MIGKSARAPRRTGQRRRTAASASREANRVVALTVAPGDAQGLAWAIDRLLADQGLRRARPGGAGAGRARVLARGHGPGHGRRLWRRSCPPRGAPESRPRTAARSRPMSGGARGRLNAFTVDVEGLLPGRELRPSGRPRRDPGAVRAGSCATPSASSRFSTIIASRRRSSSSAGTPAGFPGSSARSPPPGMRSLRTAMTIALVYEQKPAEFTDDIAEARRVLEVCATSR